MTVCHVCDAFPGDGESGTCSPECLNVFLLIGGSRRHLITAHYQMTPNTYLGLLRAQLFCCAICYLHVLDEGKALAVDHDHDCCPGSRTCGRCVRGLLCNRCNRRLGSVEAGRARSGRWPEGTAYLLSAPRPLRHL